MYISDYRNQRIRKVTGGVMSTMVGNGTVGSGGDGGAATSAQLNYPHMIVMDGANNLYIADAMNYKVRKVSSGVITTLAGTGSANFSGDGGPAVNATFNYPVAVALDGNNNLYVGDRLNGRIRKINSVSSTPTPTNTPQIQPTNTPTITPTSQGGSLIVNRYAGSGTLGFVDGSLLSAQFNWNQGMTFDSAGNMYIADILNNRIRKISGGSVTTVAGTGTAGYYGDGGSALSAWLNYPADVAIYPNTSKIYISDWQNNRIRVIENGNIYTVAGIGDAGHTGDGGQAGSAQINQPYGIEYYNGSLYFACYGDHTVRCINLTTNIITTVAGVTNSGTYDGEGTATQKSLYNPLDVCFDGSGNMYISDYRNHRIRKVTGGVISTVAGNGVAGSGGDGGAATGAQLNYPHGIKVDGANTLFIADAMNYKVRRVSGGIISTLAGTGVAGSGGDGGVAISAQFNYPVELAIGNNGTLYIADRLNGRIRHIANAATPQPVYTPIPTPIPTNTPINPPTYTPTPQGGSLIIDRYAGNGSLGFADGSSLNAQFNWNQGMSFDSSGNMYIADINNHRIRKIADGTVSTIAGTGTAGYNNDGISALSAWLNSPADVAIDPGTNKIYISDWQNNRIRVIDGGIINTYAGTGTAGHTGDGGQAGSAQIHLPYGIEYYNGSLYFACYGDHTVRRIDLSNNIITTVAGVTNSGTYDGEGMATQKSLYNPLDVCFDIYGNMYISDYRNQRIRKVTGGVISTFVGNGTVGSGGDGGAATGAQLNYPHMIVMDGANNLYIADAMNYKVRKVSGGYISTFAGTGAAGYSGDGGPAVNAAFNYPAAVAINSNGTLFISDRLNGRIRNIPNAAIPFPTPPATPVATNTPTPTFPIPTPSPSVNINTVENFPDSNFRIAAEKMVGVFVESNPNLHPPFTATQAAAVTGVQVYMCPDIVSMRGIEYFTNLHSFQFHEAFVFVLN